MTRSTPYGICFAIRQANGLGLTHIDIATSGHPPLLTLVSQIIGIPIAWRKFILDCCRIQSPVFQNARLLDAFHRLEPKYASWHLSDGIAYTVALDNLIPYIDQATSHPVSASYLSYFVRAETTLRKDEFRAQRTLALEKEIGAAIECPSNPTSILDYSGIFGTTGKSLHSQLVTRPVDRVLKSRFDRHLNYLKQSWSNFATLPLIPDYNRHKNVGYTTQIEYLGRLGLDPFLLRSVTSLDLLRLYFESGDTVSGPLEVRIAWFFNDLKPRVYYCIGGDAYFGTLYIQFIANAIAEALPSTNPHSRFNIFRLSILRSHEVAVTYDYTSFTTSLEELQDFMFHLADSFRGTPIDILDRGGVRTIDVGHYLHDYNQLLNRNQVFSLERYEPCSANDSHRPAEDGVFRQGRSGSLGVKGNIVMSMVLHGISLADFTGLAEEESCVGDDALTKVLKTCLDLFFLVVNQLGEVNREKFTTWDLPLESQPTDVTLYQFKYLKRPLSVGVDGRLYQGLLDFFPSIADAIFPEGDGIHDCRGSDVKSLITTFVMQWGRFLVLQREDDGQFLEVLNEGDVEFLLAGIRTVYRRYGVPLEGALPGTLVRTKEEEISYRLDVFAPPVNTDVFSVDWMEYLLIQHAGKVYQRPVRSEGTILPPLQVEAGERFVATAGPFPTFLVDMGYLESTVLTELAIFDETAVDYELRAMRAGVGERVRLLYEYLVVREPSFYFDYVVRLYPDLINEDPEQALSRATSLLGV